MDKYDALAALAALSQETRLDVFRSLIRAGTGGMTAGEIGKALAVRQNTLSAHLTILSRAGLIRSTREGRCIRYFSNLEGLRGVLAFLMEECCGGRPGLCRSVLDEILPASDTAT